MRQTLIVLFVFAFAFASTSLATPKSWLDQNADKISHGLYGATVAGISFKRGADANSMLLNAAIAGALKELFDVKSGEKWDKWDWLATIVGGAVVVAF